MLRRENLKRIDGFDRLRATPADSTIETPLPTSIDLSLFLYSQQNDYSFRMSDLAWSNRAFHGIDARVRIPPST